MEDERPAGNDLLRLDYLDVRVSEIENSLVDLESRFKRLNDRTETVMRLLEQSIRVVEFMQRNRAPHVLYPAPECERPPAR